MSSFTSSARAKGGVGAVVVSRWGDDDDDDVSELFFFYFSFILIKKGPFRHESCS